MAGLSVNNWAQACTAVSDPAIGKDEFLPAAHAISEIALRLKLAIDEHAQALEAQVKVLMEEVKSMNAQKAEHALFSVRHKTNRRVKPWP